MREHREPRCVVCRRAPAALLALQKQVGSLYFGRQATYLKIHLCRRHGTNASLRYLGSTLLLGWWGIGFFSNFVAVARDARSLVRARKLARPQGDSRESFRHWEATRGARYITSVSDTAPLPMKRNQKP